MTFLADRVRPAGYLDPYVEPVFRIEPQLRARGIQLVDELPDVVLAETGVLDRAGGSYPLILFDESDGGMLWRNGLPDEAWTRTWLKSPRVLGMIKIARYRRLALYNEPCVAHAYHVQRICDASPQALPAGRPDKVVPLSEHDYAKMAPGFGFWAFDLCRRLAEVEFDVWAERKIDVFCAATVHYDVEPITYHRHLALERLEQARRWRTVLGRGRVLSESKYADALCHSRVCVSPWGYGETTVRDYEAMYAGCVLIKPRTDFIDSHPMVDERHYVACAVDFADLEEKIDYVLTHWHDYTDMRFANRARLLECWNVEAMADRFAEIITGFLR